MAFAVVNHALRDENNGLRQERVFYDCVNPFYRFSDEKFWKFRKETAENLLVLLMPKLHRETKRSHVLPETLQICVALHYLADGCYFLTVADTVHISEASEHRIVKNFIHGLFRIAPGKIKFLCVDVLDKIKEEFYQIAGTSQSLNQNMWELFQQNT